MREKIRESRFVKGLLIYIVVFLVFTAAVLTVLTLWLRAYEATRPTACVRSYLAAGAEGELGYGWGRCLAEIDRNLQGEEELRAWAAKLMQNADYREILSEDNENRRYALYDEEGNLFAQLVLEKDASTSWGFTGWHVKEENCSIEAYRHSTTLRVPPTYTVMLGERRLDETMARTGVTYTLLEPFVNYVSPLPTLVEYQVGPYVGDQTLRVLDGAGQELRPEELDEYHYLDGTCTEREKDRVHAFVLEYLDAYLPYAGDLNRFGFMYWDQLYGKIVHGGELEQRLIQTREGFGYGNTSSIEVLSDNVRLCTHIQAGEQSVYVVDMDYRIETVGLHGPVQEDNSLRLLIAEIDGELYVQSMYTY